MGNTSYRVRQIPPSSRSHYTQHTRSHSDNGPQSNSFTTTTAPWNVTQWVDPFDPHPKVASIPIIIVVRRR